ncbi:MAG: AarF/UbiB family protein [Thermoanaerobaculia bacterium]
MSSRLPPDSTTAATVIDRRRYRRVLWFFAKAFLLVFWCDVVLRLPLLRILRRDPVARWTRIAARFRALAVELGGVLIKLGQFLSARVDLLPSQITKELAGLQDEVPPADFEAVTRQIEEDFGRPLDQVFGDIRPEPVGAASLAQVHEAELRDGRAVVVKVLRPGIDVLVETDLRVVGRVIGWLRWWRFIRERVDLDWMVEEFTATTRRELDLRAEGRNAERFAENFADDPGVVLPRIFWEATAARTLTEENVAFIKITDREAMRAAGIDPAAVARKLYRVYMRQIFVHDFVHADPHPGNLFVKPAAGDGDAFQIVFVDFGMVAEIPPRLRAALRLFIVGLGSRDAGLVVQALRDAGYLLPGADLAQLEDAFEAAFERFWGMELGRLNDLVMNEAWPLWKEFGRVLLETPIQVQVDLMFTGRAVELIGALTTDLDVEFNPWLELAPFAEMLASDAADKPWPARAAELFDRARRLADLPSQVDRVANLVQRGRLTVRSSLAPDSRRQLERLERAVDRLGLAVITAALLGSGALLYAREEPWLGAGLFATAVVVWVASRFLPRV